MVQPDEGQVLFKGQPWSRQALAKTGVLIETPPLYGNLSARENLLVRTTALGLPESRISQVLETVELTDTGKKKAGSLPPPGRKKRKRTTADMKKYALSATGRRAWPER